MNTYTYIFTSQVSNSVQITVKAHDIDEAYAELLRKIVAAEAIDIRLPRIHTFELTTRY
ncbi:MAG TPA: hypothetical protein VFM18_17570 [Methanosarcina sp.]|nr:hypothetical protein [Methanosarcina sp.]